MSYIGKIPTVGNFQVCDAISVVNNQAAYTMQVGSVNVSPESANHMIVSLNGVIQKPTDAFTVSGSTITFASNLVTNDVINFIQILGNVLDLGVPSDSTVSLAKLTATGTKSSSTFLRGDNTFNAPPLGGITVADQWRITADHSGVAVITANWERVDTDGYGTIGSAMTESSGIFTFPSTGIYHINFIASAYTAGGSTGFMRIGIETTVNNSSYGEATNGYMSMYTDGAYSSTSTLFIFDVTDTSSHKVRFALNQNSSATPKLVGNTGDSYTYVNFLRLGDT